MLLIAGRVVGLGVVVHRAREVDDEGDVAGIDRGHGRGLLADRTLAEDAGEEQRRLAAVGRASVRTVTRTALPTDDEGVKVRDVGVPGAVFDVGGVQLNGLAAGRC